MRLKESAEANEALTDTHASRVDEMEEERRALERQLEEERHQFAQERAKLQDELKPADFSAQPLLDTSWPCHFQPRLCSEESPKRLHATMHSMACQTISWDEMVEERVATALAAHVELVDLSKRQDTRPDMTDMEKVATALAAHVELVDQRLDTELARTKTMALSDLKNQSAQAEWLSQWEVGEEAAHLAHAPPLLLAGFQANKTLLPARFRIDMDRLEMHFQPLAPTGPPEHIALSSVGGIHRIDPSDDELDGATSVLQLNLQGEGGRTLMLLAGDEEGTEALLAALVSERTGPGEMLLPP